MNVDKIKDKAEDWVEDKVEEANKSPKRALVYGGFVVLTVLIGFGVLVKGCGN